MTKAASTTKPVTPKTKKPSQPAKTKAAKSEVPAAMVSAPAPTKAKRLPPQKQTTQSSDDPSSKQDRLIAMMRQAKGSAMAEMMEATGWEAHSIRGLISGVLKKRLNLNVVLESSSDGVRRYRILKLAQA